MSRRNRTWIAVACCTIAGVAALLHEGWSPPGPAVVPSSPPVAKQPVSASVADVGGTSSSAIPVQDPTRRRAMIWNTKDVRAAAEAISANGTADEKRWASDLVRECLTLISTPLASEVTDAIAANAARRGPALNGRMDAATSALQQRCGGLARLDGAQRRDLLAALASGAVLVGDDGITALQTLTAMQTRLRDGDDRWNVVEATVLDRALYCGDAYLERVAFNVLIGAIDRKVPGGDDRMSAIVSAMAPTYLNVPLSDFEALEQCALGASCNGETDTVYEANAAASANVARLIVDYTVAFANRQPSRAILAMR